MKALVLVALMPTVAHCASLGNVLDKAGNFLTSVEGSATALLVMFELLFRFVKTEKPKSWFYLAAEGLSKVGSLLSRMGALLDKALPQRTKE